MGVVPCSDNNVYAVGYGNSIEMTSGNSLDIFLIRYSNVGVFS